MKTILTLTITLILNLNFNVNTKTKNEITIAIPDRLELTKSNLWSFIDKLPLQHKDIVYQQALLESAHLQSKVTLENNNIFGMKCAKVRKHVHNGSKGKYAYYLDWRDSVVDYMLWQQHCYPKRVTKEQYYQKLQRIYSQTHNYVRILKQIEHPCKKMNG